MSNDVGDINQLPPGSRSSVDHSLRDSSTESPLSVRARQAGRFSQAIDKKQWSQREAARRLGLNASTINRARNARMPLTDRILQRAVKARVFTEEEARNLRLEQLQAVV